MASSMGGLYQPGIGGRPVSLPLVDHRSYKRQGIDKIPSVHLGPAASQMEKRGIRTDKGEVNRQIAADNKLLKEIKARITRLYNWSKAEAEKPEGQQPSMIDLWEASSSSSGPTPAPAKSGLCRRAPPCSAFCRQTASNPCSSSMKKSQI